ncbi:MAG: universal stress protein [Candidatus Methylomirabilis sp.]|nr:universal stress protein [Deltaproteobacteria bacterium]
MSKDRFEKILVPVDLADGSEKAAEYASMLAKRHGAKLYVIHVIDLSDDVIPFVSGLELEQKLHKKSKEDLAKYAESRFKGIGEVELDTLKGVPYRAILSYINEKGIDVVVMGSYGKGSVDRFLIGSTTERVMRKSPCPVLVVPPER